MVPFLREEEIDKIRFETWETDCPQMIVKQNVADNSESYYGPGRIYISTGGQLSFKLYVEQEENAKKRWGTLVRAEAGASHNTS